MSVGCSWRGGDTTWCTSYFHHLSVGVNTAGRANGVALSPQLRHLRERWERGRHSEEGGGEFGWSVFVQMRIEHRARGAQPGLSSVGSMAARNSITQEGDHCIHTTLWNGGDEDVGGSNMTDSEDRVVGHSEEDPGKRWFK